MSNKANLLCMFAWVSNQNWKKSSAEVNRHEPGLMDTPKENYFCEVNYFMGNL